MVKDIELSLEDVDPEIALEDFDEKREEYHQWLTEASENNCSNTAFSDEFTKMRTLLHERCLSRLSEKRVHEET